jgi:hypothetical protein
MLPGPCSRTLISLALALVLASVCAGCAQPGPFLSRQTTIGALKTSVSHLEYENQQLRAKMVNLETENREIENRLVEEESVNGDLSARLDNARNLLSDRGYNWDGNVAVGGGTAGRAESSGTGTGAGSGTGTGTGATPRALPAGQSTRKPRKPPFARIPNRSDSSPPPDEVDDEFTHPRIPSGEAFGPQSWRDDDAQWLPIARGSGTAAAPSQRR